jgi:hypothetical protein
MVCIDGPVEVRHVNLYVIGSEGLCVCHACEMQIVEFVRDLINLGARSRKLGWKMAQKIKIDAK